MRGRKPQPTAVKLLHNNPGRRPLNEHEPHHATIDAAPPSELASDAIALAEWARIIDTLSRGHCTAVDRATLAAYCRKYSQWVRLEAEAEKHAFLIKAPSGYPIPNPAIGMANKAMALMLKAAVELGITPSSRSRIIAAPFVESSGTAVDEFTAFQRKRRGGP